MLGCILRSVVPRGSEIARMIEDELVAQGVERYSFDHAKKHATVTWWVNGHCKFFPFPKTSPDRRALLNLRSEVRRYCREMKANDKGKIGLS